MRKESDPTILNCIICKEDRQYYAFGSCEHRKVCNFCAMRSRMLYKDHKCPLCSTKLDTVFIFETSERPSYESVFKEKDDLYPDDNVKVAIYINSGKWHILWLHKLTGRSLIITELYMPH
jgi:hypothetical protein